jgi:DNA-binding beta-propeller fold protein YncE
MNHKWKHLALLLVAGNLNAEAPSGESVNRKKTAPLEQPARSDENPTNKTSGEPKLAPVDRYMLPNGWAISPAGHQLELGGMPLHLLPIPGGPYVVVTSNGYTEHFLAIVDVSQRKVVQRVPLKEGWLGLAVSADGRRIYASGGGSERIFIFDFADGRLEVAGEIALERGTFPAGLRLNRSGTRLYAVANTADALLQIDLKTQKVTARYPVGARPYTCLLSADEKVAYVSNWGEDTVALVDLESGKTTANIRVSDRPNDLLLTSDEKRLFVSCGNRNLVSVIDTERREVIEQIDVAVSPGSPLGSTPNALALGPDGRTLFVANADNNSVAVFDIKRPGHSQSRGFMPVGWYPTALCLVGDSKQLLVANAKGSVSTPNKLLGKTDKAPGKQDLAGHQFGYIAALQLGTLSLIDLPDQATLGSYSQQVQQNTPNPGSRAEQAKPPFPLGSACPIKYVFYIIKENRTYDCIFGDMPEGNGDKDYCLFPELVTPNHHAIARQFVLFDNFYHDAEVSADGHHWVTSAYATDYVEKLWPSMYAGRGRTARRDLHDDSVAFSTGGFLWDLCARANISYRSYGEFARIRGAEPGKVRAATPSLEGHIHPTYYGADGIAMMSDSRRLELWSEEFKKFEEQGEMPRFTVLSLPGDHLLGTRPGAQTPRAMMAENDVVLGRMLEAISHSKFWPQTAVFVVEDDAQNGPDHVDCHRTVALVASPFLRRGFVDKSMYSTSSMLRTMELILGLPPLTQYDAAALPMWAAFQSKPDLLPYSAAPAVIPLDELNTAAAYGADQSLKLTLEEADTAPDGVYNEILWRAIKGHDVPLPPRKIAAFVMERSASTKTDKE